MKKISKVFLLTVISFLLVAGSAMAVAINPNRPYNGIVGDNLQTVLNGEFGVGVFDDVNSQSDAALWVQDERNVDAYIVKLFGTSNSGDIGVYAADDITKAYELTFNGAGGSAAFAIDNSGTIDFGGGVTYAGFGQAFGFWVDFGFGKIYTEDDENTAIQSLTYLIADGTAINGGGTYQGDNDWVMAFEKDAEGSNRDFDDIVFTVEDIAAVPEPTSMVLLGMGLLGLAGVTRKKIEA